MSNLAHQIKEFIEGDIVESSKDLEKFERDTSIYEMVPEVVVQPKNSEDIQKLVQFVRHNRKNHKDLSLTARSAGTCMSGGPLTESILLDFMKYFTHIKSIDTDSATVESGVYYRDFEKETLAKKNLYFPSYPASRELCAIGGIVNNNSGGEKTLQYGKTNKWLKGVHVVLSDGHEYYFEKLSKPQLDKKMAQNDFEGELYKKMFKLVSENEELIKNSRPNVTKNSSGYNIWDIWDGKNFDLSQVICGAQGTLGITTDAKLGLVKKSKFEKLYVVFFKNLKKLPDFTNDVLKTKPTSLEITDDHTFKLYLKYAREMSEILGAGGIVNTTKLFFPEFLIVAQLMGLPKIVTLVQFEGDNESELNKKIAEVEKIVKKYKLKGRVTKSKLESEKYWKLRRDTFKLLRERIKDRHSTPFIDDISIRPEELPEFIPKLTTILDRYNIIYTISGHLGDGNLHVIPLIDLSKKEERDKIYQITDEVFDLILQVKGTLTAEHNDGLIRSPYLEKEFGPEVFNIFKQIKEIFDPENIFNPHKKTDSSLEYAKQHMIGDKQYVQHHPHRKT